MGNVGSLPPAVVIPEPREPLLSSVFPNRFLTRTTTVILVDLLGLSDKQ